MPVRTIVGSFLRLVGCNQSSISHRHWYIARASVLDKHIPVVFALDTYMLFFSNAPLAAASWKAAYES